MLPSETFLSAFWLWCTREELRAALAILLFALVLIGICFDFLSFSYICIIVFLCTCELLFEVLCLLTSLYEGLHTAYGSSNRNFLHFVLSTPRLNLKTGATLASHITNKIILINTINTCFVQIIIYSSYPRTKIFLSYLR